MKEVHLQGAQVSSVQLDVKQHSNKTLSELQMLLQTASTLKGAVTGVTKGGDVIFTTVQGRFSAQLPAALSQTLNKGDKLTIKIEINNEQLIGRLVSVNGASVKGAQAIAVNLIESAVTTGAANPRVNALDVNLNPLKLPDAPIKAVVDYLNLSHINKNSALGKVLTPATNGSTLEMKVTAFNENSLKNPYSVTGEVLSSEGNKQIIKTPFGIVSASGVEALPEGKKIQIEVSAVDNKPVDNVKISANVEDFVFKLNNDFHLLKSLFNIPTLKNLPQGSSLNANQTSESINRIPENSAALSQVLKAQIITGVVNNDSKVVVANSLQNTEQLFHLMNSLGTKTPADLIAKLNLLPKEQIANLLEFNTINSPKAIQSAVNLAATYKAHNLQSDEPEEQQALKASAIIEKAIKTPQAKETILKLSEDFNKIKELLNIEIRPEENNKWLNFFIPIYDGERVTQNKIAIRKQPNQYIRFVVELSLEALGNLQLDGLIKLKPASNIPENFDLAVRFKDRLNPEVQTQIAEIYKSGQDISGVKGALNFERVDDFSSELELV